MHLQRIDNARKRYKTYCHIRFLIYVPFGNSALDLLTEQGQAEAGHQADGEVSGEGKEEFNKEQFEADDRIGMYVLLAYIHGKHLVVLAR